MLPRTRAGNSFGPERSQNIVRVLRTSRRPVLADYACLVEEVDNPPETSFGSHVDAPRMLRLMDAYVRQNPQVYLTSSPSTGVVRPDEEWNATPDAEWDATPDDEVVESPGD